MEMPFKIVSMWLNKLYVSIIDPDRCREVFKRTNAFSDKTFLKKFETLSDEADRAVFDASFMGDLDEVKKYLAGINPDLLDIIVFRFNLQMAETETEEGMLVMPGPKPDIWAAFRLFLIVNDQIRNGPLPKH